jgi:hypothetical protein
MGLMSGAKTANSPLAQSHNLSLLGFNYHVASRIALSEMVLYNRPLQIAVSSYIAGCEHLNELAGGKLIDKSFSSSLIDLSGLEKDFKAREDNLIKSKPPAQAYYY